ncbi:MULTISPECIES: GNAT family N-acetyltransferase [Enterobacter]|uniref:GNAT family N-acetyltransferase n=1 Tax=Enterobacter TaxID=547 RepID=UPI003899B4FA
MNRGDYHVVLPEPDQQFFGQENTFIGARRYVFVAREEKPRVMGYYTLSGSCFEKEYFPGKTQQKRVPYKNVPSVTLGRLAIDNSIQRQGYGETLVTHAMKVVYHASQAVGIHGMFVEALSDDAKNFYLGLGFILLKRENSNALFLSTTGKK